MLSRISIWKPTLITALIYCVIGLCIIVKPDAFSNYILKLMGILGIFYGGYSFLRYFYEYKNEDANILDIAIGVVVFVLGVFLILFQKSINNNDVFSRYLFSNRWSD